MRRLAKQSRDDRVLSKRDYQTIHSRTGILFKLDKTKRDKLVFCAQISDIGNVPFVGVGGYARCDVDSEATFILELPNGQRTERKLTLRKHWTPVGFAADCEKAGQIRLVIELGPGSSGLAVWGLSAAPLNLPQTVVDQKGHNLKQLNSTLAPEGLYLPHEEALELDPIPEEWEGAHQSDATQPAQISVKKCAYCQRFLPIDKDRPSALAFHKHNAKISGHQNECRACKKWRINNDFNPKRTTDQLHESSVITRERGLFLRDPVILQEIKDRDGAGLKSIVWNRFGRKCFRCGKNLELKDVRLDHTRPMAYLWPIDRHATCLCEACNNHKKDRFPVEVYDEVQLRRLSEITGLAHEELIRRDVNEQELKRILDDIEGFARQWDERMFNATARKVRELRKDVDLFKFLKRKNAKLYAEVMEELAKRPGDEEDEGLANVAVMAEEK